MNHTLTYTTARAKDQLKHKPRHAEIRATQGANNHCYCYWFVQLCSQIDATLDGTVKLYLSKEIHVEESFSDRMTNNQNSHLVKTITYLWRTQCLDKCKILYIYMYVYKYLKNIHKFTCTHLYFQMFKHNHTSTPLQFSYLMTNNLKIFCSLIVTLVKNMNPFRLDLD